MASLDTLSTFGSELSAEQLDDVDGGFFWVIVVFGIGVLVGMAIAG